MYHLCRESCFLFPDYATIPSFSKPSKAGRLVTEPFYFYCLFFISSSCLLQYLCFPFENWQGRWWHLGMALRGWRASSRYRWRGNLVFILVLINGVLNHNSAPCYNIWKFVLQVRFRVLSIKYPPVPNEQKEDAKPFAPMEIIVSYYYSSHIS